jgi:hypothetical protein
MNQSDMWQLFDACQSTCDINRFTSLQSFENREMEISKKSYHRSPKVANPEIAICEIMKTSGPSNHLECGPLIRIHFGASDIRTWSVKRLYHGSVEISKCRNAKHVLAQSMVAAIGHIGGR